MANFEVVVVSSSYAEHQSFLTEHIVRAAKTLHVTPDRTDEPHYLVCTLGPRIRTFLSMLPETTRFSKDSLPADLRYKLDDMTLWLWHKRRFAVKVFSDIILEGTSAWIVRRRPV